MPNIYLHFSRIYLQNFGLENPVSLADKKLNTISSKRPKVRNISHHYFKAMLKL